MTFSSLTDKQMVTTKRSSRGGVKVSRVIVHHWAGTNEAGLNRLVHSTDKASANYLILTDGTLIGSVPEEYQAWTSGSPAADAPSITVEVQNSTGAPDWKVSAAAIATLVKLIADVAKRYGFTPKAGTTVRGHREFAATACPGPYLYPRLPQIAKDAASLKPATPTPAPAPKPSPSKSVAQMATEVIAGKHGNGHAARQKSLGVSAAVYAQVRAEVNRRAGVSTPAPSPAKSVAQMATEVIAGKHGNGHAARQKSLGITAAQYAQVRAEVNRRMN